MSQIDELNYFALRQQYAEVREVSPTVYRRLLPFVKVLAWEAYRQIMRTAKGKMFGWTVKLALLWLFGPEPTRQPEPEPDPLDLPPPDGDDGAEGAWPPPAA